MKTTLIVLTAACALGGLCGAARADEPLIYDEIKQTVDSHLADVKACLKQHGAATGKLVVKFAIQPNGHVENPAPSVWSSNPALDKCIAAQFAKWEFPKPRGGVLMGVVYPFMFAPPPAPANLTDQQVLDTVRAHVADIKGCYDAALKTKNDLAGTVSVQFTVGPTGQVAETKLHESSAKHPALETCIVGKTKTWMFPKPTGAGNFVFNYPFVLTVPKPDKDKDKKKEGDSEEM